MEKLTQWKLRRPTDSSLKRQDGARLLTQLCHTSCFPSGPPAGHLRRAFGRTENRIKNDLPDFCVPKWEDERQSSSALGKNLEGEYCFCLVNVRRSLSALDEWKTRARACFLLYGRIACVREIIGAERNTTLS